MQQTTQIDPALVVELPKRLKPEQAAEYLTSKGFTVKPATLSEWRSTGRNALPYIKAGKCVYYQVEALDAFLLAKGLGADYQAANQNGERIVREEECARISGLSRSERHRRMKAGTFPQSFNLGGARCVGWKYSDLQAWLDGLTRKGGV